eukprot:g2713.t1
MADTTLRTSDIGGYGSTNSATTEISQDITLVEAHRKTRHPPELWRIKILYFIVWVTQGSVLPFQALFFQSRGLSSSQIGLLAFLAPIARMLGSPLFALLADISQQHRLVLTVLLLASAFTRWMQVMVPARMGPIMLWYILAEFTIAAVIPFVDSAAIKMLGSHRQGLYGRQRLWGSVGWGFISLLMGALMDAEDGSLAAIDLLFTFQALFSVCNIVYIWAIPFHVAPSRSPSRSNLAQTAGALEVPCWEPLCHLLESFDFLLLCSMVLTLGIQTGVMMNFLFIYMKTDLHSSGTIIGLALAVTCVAELPFFFFASNFTQLLGHFGVLGLALVCYFLRFWIYTLVSEAWMILPDELFHGITLAAAWSAATEYVQLRAPPGYATTVQAILQSLQWGLGLAIGGLLGGLSYEKFGAIVTFRFFAIAGLIPLVAWLSRTMCHCTFELPGNSLFAGHDPPRRHDSIALSPLNFHPRLSRGNTRAT